jgi:hypothetical protein
VNADETRVSRSDGRESLQNHREPDGSTPQRSFLFSIGAGGFFFFGVVRGSPQSRRHDGQLIFGPRETQALNGATKILRYSVALWSLCEFIDLYQSLASDRMESILKRRVRDFENPTNMEVYTWVRVPSIHVPSFGSKTCA